MSEDVIPPHHSWFVQFRDPGDEEWLTWSPTHERPKAVARKKEIQAQHPEFEVRLIRETVRYVEETDDDNAVTGHRDA